MTAELKPGMRLQSAVSPVEVVVVKAPGGAVDLRCGGQPMVPRGTDAPAATLPIDPAFAGELPIGKRFSGGGVEVMVTKPGAGLLSIDGEVLERMDAKKLPSSD